MTMPPESISLVTQFGTAGLIAWMWLTERRQSATRDKQLTEAHNRLIEQRLQLEQLLKVVTSNTSAVTALESSQRRLAELLDRLAGETYKASSQTHTNVPPAVLPVRHAS